MGVTVQGCADWSRGSGCFLVAGSDAYREALTEEPCAGGGALRGNVRQMSSIQAQRQALAKAHSARRVEKCPSLPLFFIPPPPPTSSTPPCFLVNPPRLPCCCCFPLFVHACLSISSSLASAWISSLIVLCQLFCWCFLLYFHLTRLCRAYQGLLTAPAVRYLSAVYLSGDILSSLQRSHSQAGLFGQALDPLTPHAVCFEFWGYPVTKNCLACFK